MTDLEERLRAVTYAAADEIPPASIGPWRGLSSPPVRRGRPAWLAGHPGWGIRLAPLAAAAAVVVLVAGSVALGHTLSGRPGHGDGRAGVAAAADSPPPYYLALRYDSGLGAARPGEVVVWSTATGRQVQTLSPPKGTAFTALSGTGTDSETFVLAATPLSFVHERIKNAPHATGLNALDTPDTFVLVRLGSDGHPSFWQKLPIPAERWMSSFALSPDGRGLAETLTSKSTLSVKVFQLPGQTLPGWVPGTASRTWSAASTSQLNSVGGAAWAPGDRVYYQGAGRGADSERNGLLDISSPSGGLLADTAKAPAGCGASVITTEGVFVTLTPQHYPSQLRECALRDGRVRITIPSRSIRYGQHPVLVDGILWASPDGRRVIVGASYPGSFAKSVIGTLRGTRITALHTSPWVAYATFFSGGAATAW